MAATLRVSGRQRMLDRYRRWDDVLDGAVVGVIANGEATDLPVEHGTHTERGDRLPASPLRAFPVEDEDTVRFVCRPRPHPAIWLPYGVASLYRHDLFIVLEPASG